MKLGRFPWLPALLVGAGLLLLLAAGYGLLTVNRSPTDPALPAELAGLPLAGQTNGAAAIAALRQMHGQQFQLVSGAIGEYGPAGQATLWVSGAGSVQAARQMLADMTDRIARGRSPFTPLDQRSLDGRTVYALEGMGQQHFYFQAGDRLVWLAANAELAEQALEQSLAAFP